VREIFYHIIKEEDKKTVNWCKVQWDRPDQEAKILKIYHGSIGHIATNPEQGLSRMGEETGIIEPDYHSKNPR